MNLRNAFPFLLSLSLPAAMLGFSGGPLIKRAGVPADGGLTCAACHRGLGVNEGPGRVTIDASGYHPGRLHTVKVIVEDPSALRWGFQLTARLQSDPTREAGVFLPGDGIQVRCDPDGRPVPAGSDTGCGGALEFAEHTRPATMAGTAGPRTFEVRWLAPGRNVGNVVFYTAANAANNDNANTGDHIYTASRQVEAEDCESRSDALPTITAVRDAAAGIDAISSNTIISIYGGPFASEDDRYGARRGDLREGKVPTDLACVAVEVAGARVPVFYVQSNQINAQAPIIHGSGMVDVRVIRNPGTPERESPSAVFRVQHQTYTPALFTFDGKSVAARNASTNYSLVADPTKVPGAAPAKPNDVVVLYGTGFGFTEPIYQPGEFSEGVVPVKEEVKIVLGGVTLAQENVLYAGLSPEAPGFYQFNVRLPESVADGDVPVRMSVGGMETQAGTTLPVKR